MLDFSKASKADKIKFAIFALVIIGLIALGIALLPFFTDLARADTRLEAVQDIRSKGAAGVLILFALQVLQVVIAFIPGEVVQLMAGLIYGGLGGIAICLAGVALASACMFLLVRKLGMPFVQSMVSQKDIDKFGKYFQDSNKLDAIVFILFLIPGMPKDVFTFFVPMTDMSLKKFLALTLPARIPALAASTFGASAFLQGKIGLMIVLLAGCGIVAALCILFKDRILDKLSAFRHRSN